MIMHANDKLTNVKQLLMLLNAEPQTQYTKGKPLMLLGNKLQMLQI